MSGGQGRAEALSADDREGGEKCYCARYAGPHMKENRCPQYAMGSGWPGYGRRKK